MPALAKIPTTIYPSCWVKLQLRVEDFKARQNVFIPDTPPAEGMDPIAQTEFLGIETILLPQHCTVNLRSYREGDEAKIDIPASALPVDPRVIRQGAVQIFMGLLDPRTYGETQGPIQGNAKIQLIPEVDPTSQRSNEVFRGFIDTFEVVYDGDDMVSIACRDITAVFIDEEVPIQALKDIPGDMPLDQVIQAIISGEPLARSTPPDDRSKRPAKLEARSASRTLRHQLTVVSQRLVKAQTAVPPNPAEITRLTNKQTLLAQQLSAAVARAAKADADPIIAPRYGMRSARDVKVVNATGAPLPTLSQLKGASWFDSKKGAVRISKRGGSNEKISYWDLITDICIGCGYICYVKTNAGVEALTSPRAEIIIDHPRTYYTQAGTALRKFVYGYNIDTVSLSRNYGGRGRPAAIVVTATDDATGESISARWPRLPLNSKGGLDKEAVKDIDDAETFLLRDRIPGASETDPITAQQRLETIAHSLFEQRGRAEMELQIETTIQSALEDNDSETYADLLALRAADTIELELRPPELIDNTQPFVTPAGFQALSYDEKISRLMQVHKFSLDLATQIAQAYESPFLQKFFRVKEVSIEFSPDEGFNFQISALNYLDARFAEEVVG